ncbi:unnamed protein product [Onchocerca flexuosa]|uniref:Secreted protein n=1 Tax=Onchocerca flexuosa TaxID=387005 RepID=A0A183I4V3_9BILA|nr:unnamed protein product [Onchocerca flexuosa]
MSPFWICIVANLPPSADFLLYKGYPSFPVTMLDTNARGYRLEHFRSIMHGKFGFSIPQNPCIIFFVTTLYKSLSTSELCISAHITSSISFEPVTGVIDRKISGYTYIETLAYSNATLFQNSNQSVSLKRCVEMNNVDATNKLTYFYLSHL